jgi:hypothetical protein
VSWSPSAIVRSTTSVSFFVSALPRIGGSRWPEALGLLAGPGLLLMLGDATVRAPGAAIVALAVVGYGLAGRARCTRVA